MYKEDERRKVGFLMIMFIPVIKSNTHYNPGQINRDKELSATSKAILHILEKESLSFVEIVKSLNEPEPRVMGHLTGLRKMGLVKKNKNGKFSLIH